MNGQPTPASPVVITASGGASCLICPASQAVASVPAYRKICPFARAHGDADAGLAADVVFYLAQGNRMLHLLGHGDSHCLPRHDPDPPEPTDAG